MFLGSFSIDSDWSRASTKTGNLYIGGDQLSKSFLIIVVFVLCCFYRLN